jgi:hypothetical protein
MFVRFIFMLVYIHLIGVCCQEKKKKPRLAPGREYFVSERGKDTTEAQRQAKPVASSKRRMGRLSDMAGSTKIVLDSLTPEEKLVYYGLPSKKRGRPRDHSKRKIWAEGLRLRAKNEAYWSWANLARRLTPEEYKKDPHGATGRMRQGILSVLKMLEKNY